MKPRYPVYVPSKGRSHLNRTVVLFQKWGVPFHLVVEPQDRADYAARFGESQLLVLPENDRGLIWARNWMVEHAVASGAERHWQIDDNIRRFNRLFRGKRLNMDPNIALRLTEDFVERYENVAIAGLNYDSFCCQAQKPFVLNVHVYSCTLFWNKLPNRFRQPANEDVDMCLQVLADGWCTVAMNAFCVEKQATMKSKGGQTDAAYRGDGRLFMARALERAWPGVVRTGRRYERPQHVVRDSWKRFDTPLKRRADVEVSGGVDEHGMKLVEREGFKAKSPAIRAMLDDPPRGRTTVEDLLE